MTTSFTPKTAEGSGPPPHTGFDEKQLEDEIRQAAEKPQLGVAIDVRRFIAKSASMFDRQRTIVLDLEAELASGRAAIVADYKRRLADLEHEGAEKIRALEADKGAIIGEARQVLEALGRLRGA